MAIVIPGARIGVSWMCWLTMLVVGCHASQPQETRLLRSPSTDYQPPPPVTSDGWVVGADNTSPTDRLEQGARIGIAGGLAPGWRLTKDGLSYDPRLRVGGAVSVETVAMGQ